MDDEYQRQIWRWCRDQETPEPDTVTGLITWADYCYWVKDKPIMHDHTFDLLVREYEKRLPDDRDFLDKIGMWGR
jgi:hypothetical protein